MNPTRCSKCGRFARRSIIGPICVPCIKKAGFTNVWTWVHWLQSRKEK